MSLSLQAEGKTGGSRYGEGCPGWWQLVSWLVMVSASVGFGWGRGGEG